jgi:hypothetical protein
VLCPFRVIRGKDILLAAGCRSHRVDDVFSVGLRTPFCGVKFPGTTSFVRQFDVRRGGIRPQTASITPAKRHKNSIVLKSVGRALKSNVRKELNPWDKPGPRWDMGQGIVARGRWPVVRKERIWRFLESAERGRNMPISRLEMVSFTFRFNVKRDRNAGGTDRYV